VSLEIDRKAIKWIDAKAPWGILVRDGRAVIILPATKFHSSFSAVSQTVVSTGNQLPTDPTHNQ
jgi:hypothetical protein